MEQEKVIAKLELQLELSPDGGTVHLHFLNITPSGFRGDSFTSVGSDMLFDRVQEQLNNKLRYITNGFTPYIKQRRQR